MTVAQIKGFRIRLDLAHDLDRHMWVEVRAPDRVRVGMDPLGLETSGTLAQLAFEAPGATVERGDPFGSLEAEKFVGALAAPVGGQVAAVNEAVVADPGLAERDPYGAGWLVEMVPADLERDLAQLTSGPDAVAGGFEEKVAQYRRDGVLAE